MNPHPLRPRQEKLRPHQEKWGHTLSYAVGVLLFLFLVSTGAAPLASAQETVPPEQGQTGSESTAPALDADAKNAGDGSVGRAAGGSTASGDAGAGEEAAGEDDPNENIDENTPKSDAS